MLHHLSHHRGTACGACAGRVLYVLQQPFPSNHFADAFSTPSFSTPSWADARAFAIPLGADAFSHQLRCQCLFSADANAYSALMPMSSHGPLPH